MYEQYVKEYQDNGWTRVPSLFSRDEVSALEDELVNFVKKRAEVLKRDEINFTPDGKINSIHRLAGIDADNSDNYFFGLLNSDRMKNFAQHFLNDESEGRRMELFAKPAGVGMKSPWHQDNFYWCISNANALTIWVALDTCGSFNGGVSYISGSHKWGLQEHTDSFAPGSSQTVANQELLKSSEKLMVCPDLQPGDALIHHSLTIHGSADNLSQSSRRGITFQYKGVHAEYDKRMQQHYNSRLNAQVDMRTGSAPTTKELNQ